MNQRLIRLGNELKDIEQNPPSHWKVVKQSQSVWDIWVTADNSCPYWGVPFKIIATFPEEYPFKIPTFIIEKPQLFYHPNISGGGVICQATLKKVTPAINTKQRMEAVLHILGYPNPDSPYNGDAADIYKKDQQAYTRKAFKVFRGLEKQ